MHVVGEPPHELDEPGVQPVVLVHWLLLKAVQEGAPLQLLLPQLQLLLVVQDDCEAYVEQAL